MEWQPIETAPDTCEWFFVKGGTWQTDCQSRGMNNDGAVRVRKVIRLNKTDSPFVTEDGDAIKNPSCWSWVNDPPCNFEEARQVILKMHEALLSFRNPEFDFVKEGRESEFDERVKNILSISAPVAKEQA